MASNNWIQYSDRPNPQGNHTVEEWHCKKHPQTSPMRFKNQNNNYINFNIPNSQILKDQKKNKCPKFLDPIFCWKPDCIKFECWKQAWTNRSYADIKINPTISFISEASMRVKPQEILEIWIARAQHWFDRGSFTQLPRVQIEMIFTNVVALHYPENS